MRQTLCDNCGEPIPNVVLGDESVSWICPAGGTHDWHTITTKDGKKISVCQKCGATK